MEGSMKLAFFLMFILFAGCTLPETGYGAEQEPMENAPAIRQVDKSVAIVDGSAKTPSAEPEPEPEAEPEEAEPEPEAEEKVGILLEFQPSELVLDCTGDCMSCRVYDAENGIVITALGQNEVLLAKERAHFKLYPLGCAESADVVDTFEIGGKEYWFSYPASFKRDLGDFADFEGNETGFSLHEWEIGNFEGGKLFIWEIVPGPSSCEAWIELSIFDEAITLDKEMEGVMLGLDQENKKVKMSYLIFPEGTID